MKIKEILVDGFGIHRDLHLKDIKTGLNIVYGNNEDGKTTLRNFITTILFGFKPRNDIRRYNPVRGGSHGGKLLLHKDCRHYEVSRLLIDGKSNTDAVISSKDDGPCTLSSLLGEINRGVYDNIFSFGLDELSGIKSLTDKEVVEHIYTAGFGVKSSDIKGIKKELSDSLNSLWKPRGNKTINTNLDKLNNIISKKIEFQNKNGSYIELTQKVEQINASLEEMTSQNQKMQEELIFYKGLEQGLPLFTELSSIEKQLAHYQVKGDYSQEDMANLKNYMQRLEELSEEKQLRSNELRDIQREIENTNRNFGLIKGGKRLKELERSSIGIRDKIKQNWDKIKGAEKTKKEMGSLMEALDRKFTKDIKDIKSPLGIEEQLNEIGTISQEKSRELEIINREIVSLESEVREILEEIERLSIKDDKQLENVIEILYELKNSKESKIKGDMVPISIVVLNLLAILVSSFMGYSPWVLATLGIVSVVLSLYLVYRNLFEPKKKKEFLGSKLQKASNGKIRSINDIDGTIREFERESLNLKNLTKEMDKKQQKIKGKEKEALLISNFLEEINFEKETVLQAIGIDKSLTPYLAVKTIGKISEGKKMVDLYEETLNEIAENEKELEYFLLECKEELSQMGYIAESDDLEGWLLKLQISINDLEKENQLVLKIQNLTDKSNDIKKYTTNIDTKIAEIDQKCKFLLEKGQVDTYSQYISSFEQYLRIIELRQMKLTMESKLKAILPGELEQIKEIFSGVSQTTIEPEILKLKELIEQIKANHDALIQEKGRLKKEIEDIEKDYSLEQIMLQEEILKEEIKNDSVKWCTYNVAMSLLEKTIKVYEDKTQPSVFKRAERFFTKVTNSKYQKIKIKRETQQIVVCDNAGREVDAELLSRGTQEQLYICVRLGLIEEFSMKSGSLPLIFDDIFVNFDEQRTKEALELLIEFCSNQQVLFFTCHKRIVDILEGNTNINVINL